VSNPNRESLENRRPDKAAKDAYKGGKRDPQRGSLETAMNFCSICETELSIAIVERYTDFNSDRAAV
jgi:hypothetical protein